MRQQIVQTRRRVSPSRGAGGATLIELLAVIIIMTMLAAAALPVIAPAMQNRQVREASRIVNGFITGARNRAMQTGRPVGVVLERMQGLPEACVTLSYAEVPAPYAGDSLGSTADFGGGAIQALTKFVPDPANPTNFTSLDIGWIGTVRVGDLIKFNYIGHTFQITGALRIDPAGMSPPAPIPPDANGYFTAAATPGSTCIWTLAPTSLGATLPGGNPKYQIFRAPVRMAAGSVQLPGTTVIDLTCSGFDNTGQLIDSSTSTSLSPWVSTQTFQPLPATLANSAPVFASGGMDTSSVTLTFGPSGAVDRVWCWQFAGNNVLPYSVTLVNPTPTSLRPTQAIHLMVGLREYLPLPAAPPAISDPNANGFKPFLNWQDVGNFWVSINPQSGLVTTTEVLQAPSFTIIPGTPPQYGAYIELISSRKLAREANAMGGR